MERTKQAPERTAPAIWEILVLIAGVAAGLGLVAPAVPSVGQPSDRWILTIGGVLGGISLVGPLLLLRAHRCRTRARPWRAGRVFWFAHGAASWLLWPPMIGSRAHSNNLGPASV